MAIGRSITRRQGGVIAKARQYAGAIRLATALGKYAYNRWTSSKSSGGGSGTAIVSSHTDNRVAYSRRRAPARVRARGRRWGKFVKKVVSAYDSSLPNQKIIIQDRYTASAPNLAQGVVTSGMEMFGHCVGTASYRDLDRMEVALGTTASAPKKIHIDGGQLEGVIQNNADTGCYIEMYYWVCKKDSPLVNGRVVDMFGSGLNTQSLVGATGQSIFQAGVTPFQSLKFCQYFKIVKKVVVKLAGHESFDFIYKTHKKRVLDPEKMQGLGYIAGLSSGILCIQYGSLDVNADIVATSTAFNMTRNYIVRCEGFDTGSNNTLTP